MSLQDDPVKCRKFLFVCVCVVYVIFLSPPDRVGHHHSTVVKFITITTDVDVCCLFYACVCVCVNIDISVRHSQVWRTRRRVRVKYYHAGNPQLQTDIGKEKFCGWFGSVVAVVCVCSTPAHPLPPSLERNFKTAANGGNIQEPRSLYTHTQPSQIPIHTPRVVFTAGTAGSLFPHFFPPPPVLPGKGLATSHRQFIFLKLVRLKTTNQPLNKYDTHIYIFLKK